MKLQVSALTLNYLELKDQLVASNFVGTQTAAKNLLKGVEGLNLKSVSGSKREVLENSLLQLLNSLTVFDAATDIKKQRALFKTISEQYAAFIKESGMSEMKLYQQYCPMALNNVGAYWFSKDSLIRNPYFGDEMLECGEVSATYEFK